MCGIWGLWNMDGTPIDRSAFEQALNELRHRGPDDEGYLFTSSKTGDYWLAGGADTPEAVYEKRLDYTPQLTIEQVAVDEPDIALGSRRLAILDLSPSGHQPMCINDGGLWIVHNGEIYNFQDIRTELESRGHEFNTGTDTEVILHAYDEWGPECVQRFNGMWAFAIWDSRRRVLFCSRDRFGIKPFYYYWDGETFLFASEIKAMLASGLVRAGANEAVVYDFLAYGRLDQSNETFFEGVEQLRGGQSLELRYGANAPSVERYYDIPLEKKLNSLSQDELAQQFYDLHEDSVRLRLISDVPVGSCLSGGLDSSSIVCVISELVRRKEVEAGEHSFQKTFSARYDDPRHDEGRYIEAVVEKTGVDALTVYPTADGLLRAMDKLIWHQEQPFGSTSIFAQWAVFESVKKAGVSVVLDGQGADEALAGYRGFNREYLASLARSMRLWTLFREANGHHRLHGDPLWNLIAGAALYALPATIKAPVRSLIRNTTPSWLAMDSVDRQNSVTPYESNTVKTNLFDRALYRRFTQGLPSLLRHEDRNSMAHSVEARVPFLDYRLVEWLFSTPRDAKIDNGTTKIVLRNAMRGLLPEVVRTRQDKIGFSTPEDMWFRNELRGFILETTNSQSFLSRPYFDHDQLQRALTEHLEGKKNISNTIWRWVNIELWMRRFID